ncbi:copper resistance protein CopC [Streptomyces sp. NPDC014864]|uniref:copper resistance CopC/CopD family protein n=1 Tax=Streptomyces sp. NPDC014864 TaxID=3364924 RepID=UPI0036F65333
MAALLGAVVVLLLLGGAGPAAAHAALRTTDPADGSVLKSAPHAVTLTFTESVGLLDDSFRLLGPDGRRVRTGEAQHAPGRSDTARVTLPGELDQGTFVLAWRVVSADSHPVSGAFTFSVGRPSPTAATVGTGPAEDPVTGSLYDLARWAAYAAAALLIGTAVFTVACRPPDPGPLRKPLVAGWWALLASTVVLLVLRAPYETGAGPAAALDPSALSRTLTSRPGVVLLGRLALLLPAAAFLVRLSRRGEDGGPPRPTRATGAAGAVLVLSLALTWAAAEHASAGLQVPVALASSTLHLLAMSVWLGGLAALLTTLRRTRPAHPEPDPGAGETGETAGTGGDAPSPAPATKAGTATKALPAVTATAITSPGPEPAHVPRPALTDTAVRFSRIAFAAVTVLVVTGVYQSWRGLGSWTAFTDTSYGRLLLLKLAAVTLLLTAASQSRNWTARLLRADADATATDDVSPTQVSATDDVSPPQVSATDAPAPDAHRRGLRRAVLAEVTVGAVVLVISTVLTGTVPGRATAEAAQASPAPAPGEPGASVTWIPFDLGTSRARGKVQITLLPGRVGENTVEAVVLGPDGGVSTVPELRLSLSLPARDIGPIDAGLTDKGGYWGTDRLTLPIAGTWTMKATVRVSELDQVSESRKVRIPG